MKDAIIVHTFGCRMNTFESQCIHNMMQDVGMKQMILINTCTITGESERQVRQEIRKLHRQHPEYHIILTGCASQLHSNFFIEMPEVDFVISNELKLQKWVYEEINKWFNGDKDNKTKQELQQKLLTQNKTSIPDNNLDNDWEYIYNFEDRSRAFVPVQTGCDHFCSFCVVPFTRGKFKSYNPQHII